MIHPLREYWNEKTTFETNRCYTKATLETWSKVSEIQTYWKVRGINNEPLGNYLLFIHISWLFPFMTFAVQYSCEVGFLKILQRRLSPKLGGHWDSHPWFYGPGQTLDLKNKRVYHRITLISRNILLQLRNREPEMDLCEYVTVQVYEGNQEALDDTLAKVSSKFVWNVCFPLKFVCEKVHFIHLPSTLLQNQIIITYVYSICEVNNLVQLYWHIQF
jgi:hypothetical protein